MSRRSGSRRIVLGYRPVLRIPTLLIALLLAITAAVAQEAEPAAVPPAAGPPPVVVTPPLVALSSIDASVTLTATEVPPEGLEVEVRQAGAFLARARIVDTEPITLQLPAAGGTRELELHAPGAYTGVVPFTVRAIPGWLTLVPPALAILLALAFRQVIPALGTGVFVGAWIVFGGGLEGFRQTLDHYLIGELINEEHMYILVFSTLLGGMVGVIARSGGTAGLVAVLSRHATDRKRGQFFTWLMGLIIFFDDYTNTLVVGNTMRPVTDRLRISREKLAYIVDSTAAPVASLALVSTWIGFEVSLIADALADVGSTQDAYWIFLQAIPYGFYPILTLGMVLMIAISGRDFGPMRAAEERAAGGALLAAGATPLSNFDHADLQAEEGKPKRWYNAAVPVGVVLLVVFISQYLLGKAALASDGSAPADVGLLQGFGRVFAAGNSFQALLYGAFFGCLVAIVMAWVQGITTLGSSLKAWVEGMKTMFMAFVILALAWSIGAVCRDLGTADYLVSKLAGNLDPGFLPMLIFILAAAIAFSTGTSWSTMSILIPLAVPSAVGVAGAAGWDAGAVHTLLLASVASVLAGAIFGDHCSPISDTTVLSSMASACDHVDHVRTQLPYALLAAGVALLVGTLPAGFGVSPWISLALGLGILAAAVRFLGRPMTASSS